MSTIQQTSGAVAFALITIVATRPTLAMDPVLTCEKLAGKSLVKCVNKVTASQRKCFKDDGTACPDTHPKIIKALSKLSAKIADKCVDDATVQAAGYGPTMTVGALAKRLESICLAESASLAARVYGGPHGKVLGDLTAAATPESKADLACLNTVFKQGRKVLTKNAKALMSCVDKERKKGNCDVAKANAKIAVTETKASDKIAASCAGPLSDLIALDSTEFIRRSAVQSRCMTAIAHPDVSPLDLDCGPRDSLIATPRDTYVQVVLDEAEFGTRCGDGSPYAFWIKLAPQGEPIENIVLQMQGGGVCIFDSQCASTSADLFEALSDPAETSGIMSNDPLVSPFANWTKVYLPYCTQDVFIGGGATNEFPNFNLTVERYGAINTRAALRYVRDVVWRELDATTAEGYRPDRIRMLFGGTSAGAFGTLYNYHYVLDDLQWVHTTAWPDAALALDNGEALGVGNLGIILIANTGIGWNALAQMPPYCKTGGCAVGPTIYAASAPRLKREPEQQFLVLSNQVDSTQVSTTFFNSTSEWINTMRSSYCDTAGTTGLHYFLPAITSSTHVITTRENLYTGTSVDGILMRDWLDLAMSDPDNIFDAVEEGSLTSNISGVLQFPCTID